MISDCFESPLRSPSVCYLSLEGENMTKSRSNNRQHSNSFSGNSSSLHKKNPRQPLKCKKNIPNDNDFFKKSNCVKEPVKNNKLTKITRKQVHTWKSPCSIEIDVISKMTVTVPVKTPKRVLRSSISQKKTLHPKEVTVSDKLAPQCKSKKEQNVFNANKSIEKSSSIKKSCSVKSNILTKQHIHTYMSPCSVEICKTVPQNSPKRVLRSSLKQKMSIHPKEVTVFDKLTPQCKSKKIQNVLDEKTPHISPSLLTKNLSFSSNCLVQCNNDKTPKQNQLCHNTVTPLSVFSQETPDEAIRSSRHSMFLRSQEFSKNNSNVQLSVAPEKKQPRNSTVITRKQKADQQNSAGKISNKHLYVAHDLENTPAIKRKNVQKSSSKWQKPIRAKSCSENIPVDDLALLPFIERKTKSDGFKFPGRNTLKRKRFIIESIKNADNEYEDDIYEEKEFTSFRKMFPDSSESEISCVVSTPKLGFQLTPQIRCKTPVYKDCFSPTEYALSRKVAEEYLYRNRKRKSNSELKIPEVPEKKKLEFNKVLEDACKVQKEIEKLAADESDCEDIYFSDEEI